MSLAVPAAATRPAVPAPIPPASVRDAIAAARLGREWTAFYYLPGNRVESRFPALTAIRSRANGSRVTKRWTGGVMRGVIHELSARDWAEFAAFARGSAIVSHTLLSVVMPALRNDLSLLASGSAEGAVASRAVFGLGPKADLLEVASFLRDSVAPWAMSARIDPSDPRSAWAHGRGRALLAEFAKLESLGLSHMVAAVAPRTDFPGEPSVDERRSSAIAAIWGALIDPLLAFDVAIETPEPEEIPLGVRAHVRREDRLAPEDLAARLRISEPVAHLLAGRGLDDPALLEARLSPDPDTESPNPYGLVGMAESAQRLRSAISTRERILIWGDFDADGTGGTAVLGNFLRGAGANLRTEIGRRSLGHGMIMKQAHQVLADHEPGLVVFIDNGTSSHEAIEYLRANGVESMVLDHHPAREGHPPTPYFVNPKREDERYGFREFCGCGVAYKMVQALSSNRHEPTLYDIVATSTIADHMLIIGENRYFVAEALRRTRAQGQGNLGLAALARREGKAIGGLAERDFAFTLAPRINAVSRMDADANKVVRLLMSSDHAEAERIAAEVDAHNEDRKRLTDELCTAAIESIGPNPTGDVIVHYLPMPITGVAGLVANKLLERYERPVIVVTSEGKGSGRSPHNGTPIVRYFEAFTRHPKMRDFNFGGHDHAAGFGGADPKRLAEVARSVRVERIRAPERPPRQADADLPIELLGKTLVDEIFGIEPLIVGEEEPLFRIPNVRLVDPGRTSPKNGVLSNHLRVTLADDAGSTVTAFWWGEAGRLGKLPARADVYGVPMPGRYRMQGTSFRIERIAPVR